MATNIETDTDEEAELEDKAPWQTRKPIEPEDSLAFIVALLVLAAIGYGAWFGYSYYKAADRICKRSADYEFCMKIGRGG